MFWHHISPLVGSSYAHMCHHQIQNSFCARELLGPEAIILGAPGAGSMGWSDGLPYWDYTNGDVQENALGTQLGKSWPEVWNIYQRSMQKSPPRMHWIAVDTEGNDFGNVEAPDFAPWALQRMRLGLVTTLLGDGYFRFELSYMTPGQLWWFPEYDANLGLAKGDSQERGDGTWIRAFKNGVVVANPTSEESMIEFAEIHQDVTTGFKDLHFVVQPEGGRIFVISD